MLILGANPAVSNGSLMTAPGARHRLKAIQDRGGKVVVIDPRRTETVKHASEHVAVRPGGDPFLLLGMLHTIFADGLDDLGAIEDRCDGFAELRDLAAAWPAERAAPLAGVEARDDRAAGTRVRLRADRRRLRARRRLPAGDGHADALADQRAQRRDRQPRPARRGHVPAARRRCAGPARRGRGRPARAVGARAAARQRAPGLDGRAARRRARRRDPHARRGAGPRDDRLRRQPGPLDSRRHGAWTRRWRSSSATSPSTCTSPRARATRT